VARSGADDTVFLLRKGDRVSEIEAHQGLSVTEVVGRLILFVEAHHVDWDSVFIDEIGVGAGVVDLLREQGRRAKAVNFAARASAPERYANTRAECYWKVREALRPDELPALAIPRRFGRLAGELTSIEWRINSGGKILIEAKDKLKQRTGRSPDHADALALSYAQRRHELWIL
jgi:hypothetical protein